MTSNYNEDGNKVFRAKKTTKNRDDFKVLMVGIMLTVLMILTFPLISRMVDTHWADRPFVVATVEVVKMPDYENPMLLYVANARKTVTGTWTAVVRDEEMKRISSRSGKGNYTDALKNHRLWTWEAFFDNGSGDPAPAVPTRPFHVCVWYVVETLDHGVEDISDEVCTKLFYPTIGNGVIVGGDEE